MSTLTEAQVAAVCDDLLRTGGWDIECFEQRRPSHVALGLPDRRVVHRTRMLRLWIEYKRPGGQLTREQHAWLTAELDAGGHATVIDDVQQLRTLLGYLAGPRVGRDEQVLRYCRQLIALTAMRGYRGEPTSAESKQANRRRRVRA
jgi:hypothetical protein